MSVTLTATAKASVNWTYTETTNAANPVPANGVFSYTANISNGTGAINTADLLYFKSGTIAASGNTTFDVRGGVTDVFGNTVTMVRVKVMMVQNLIADAAGTAYAATSLSIGGDAAALVNWVGAANDLVNVRLNGCFFLSAPDATAYATTATTADVIKILNNDGSNTAAYNLVVVGSTA